MFSGKVILSEAFGFATAYTAGVFASTHLRSASHLLFDASPLAYCTVFAGAVAAGTGLAVTYKTIHGNAPPVTSMFEGGFYGVLYGAACGLMAVDHLP